MYCKHVLWFFVSTFEFWDLKMLRTIQIVLKCIAMALTRVDVHLMGNFCYSAPAKPCTWWRSPSPSTLLILVFHLSRERISQFWTQGKNYESLVVNLIYIFKWKSYGLNIKIAQHQGVHIVSTRRISPVTLMRVQFEFRVVDEISWRKFTPRECS